MKLVRTFPVLAYAVMLLSIVGVSVASRSAGLLLVGGVLAALSWYVTEGPRGRSLPNWTANVLIVAVSLNVVADFAQHAHNVLGVLGRFVVLLVLIKLYQRKTPRDWAQLLGLSVLLMLVGTLQSNDLLFAGTLLIYSALGLYVLLLFQLWAGNERQRRERLEAVPAGYRLAPALAPITGRRTALHLRGLTLVVAGAGLALSVGLFVLVPRGVGEGFMAIESSSRRTGYTDDVDLVGGARISTSRRVVMNVGTDAAVAGPLRLRGMALDRYDGRGRWRSSTLDRRITLRTEPPGLTELVRLHPDDRGVVRQDVELLVPGSTLFSLAVPVAVGTSQPRRLRFDPRFGGIEDATPGPLARYRVLSVTAPSDATLARLMGRRPTPAYRAEQAELTRQFTGVEPLRRLARDVLEQGGLPPEPPRADDTWAWNARAAEILQQHFHAGEYRYTMDLRDVRLADDDGSMLDPVLHFLFETRKGHCEYFAAGLAALCNAVGIPARLVTGYVTMEYDDRAEVHVVRESNAHAWVEVQVGPYRWRELDPTPPQSIRDLHGGAPSRGDKWRWVFDRFEARWSSNFVAFDGRAQQQLLRSIDFGWSEGLRRALVAARDWAARVNRAFLLGPAGYIWLGIVATAVLIAAVAAWTRWRRASRLRATLRLGGGPGPVPRAARQLGFYVDMLRVLEQAGHGKPAWQPPLRFARRLSRRHPEAAAIVRRLSETFYRARYGGRALERAQVARAEALVQQLAATLRRG